MKLMMLLFVFAVFMAFGFVSKGATPSSAVTGGHHLNTSFDFEDMLVQGKYQYPDEAVATVENEKLLKDLLVVRKDFKDRMKQEASRQ